MLHFVAGWSSDCCRMKYMVVEVLKTEYWILNVVMVLYFRVWCKNLWKFNVSCIWMLCFVAWCSDGVCGKCPKMLRFCLWRFLFQMLSFYVQNYYFFKYMFHLDFAPNTFLLGFLHGFWRLDLTYEVNRLQNIYK